MRYYAEFEKKLNELIKELETYYKVCTDSKQTRIDYSDYRDSIMEAKCEGNHIFKKILNLVSRLDERMFATKEMSANNIDALYLKNKLKDIAQKYDVQIEEIKKGSNNSKIYFKIKEICEKALIDNKTRENGIEEIQNQIKEYEEVKGSNKSENIREAVLNFTYEVNDFCAKKIFIPIKRSAYLDEKKEL